MFLKDVDECMESNNTLCQKGAVCTNKNGSYYCDCPPGCYRDDDKPEYECVRNKGKLVEILGMLSLYHSFLISFSVEILGMFRY